MTTKAGDVRKYIRDLKKQGWTVEETRHGWLLKHPDGKTTSTVHRSGGSDIRGMKNARRHTRGKQS